MKETTRPQQPQKTGDKTMSANTKTKYVAISPEGHLYGEGDTPEKAKHMAITAWNDKWGGGQADPVPDFEIKIDDGEYDI